MPIVRIDLPRGLESGTMSGIRSDIHDCIVSTWAREHIWIALHEMHTDPGERTVIMTVEVRPGRGREAERTRKLFDMSQKVMESWLGTTSEEMILLVREFPQYACISAGAPLPRLETLTPAL